MFLNIISHFIGDSAANIEKVEGLPMLETIRDAVNRDRNKVIGYQSATAIDIPDFLKLNRTNNLFLRYDSGYENSVHE